MKIQSVSVLIPCYNRASYIKNVIQSVLNQTRPPDEVIVVDDASKDNSIDVIRECPVQLICHSENKGPSIARNTAFNASHGDLVVFIDSDAIASAKMLEELLAVYDLYSHDENLGGVGGQGMESCVNSIYDEWRCLHGRQNFGKTYRHDVDYLFGLCCSYPKEVFKKIGGYDPFFPTNSGEDLDIGLRIHKAGFRLAYTPEASVYHYHCDDRESLQKVQYNWAYWSMVARRKNNYPIINSYLGMYRRLIFNVIFDLFIAKNLQFVKIDLIIFGSNLKALNQALRYPIL